VEPRVPVAGFFAGYSGRLQAVLATSDWSGVAALAEDMLECWRTGRRVFLCGNGGSAANAVHLANDFLYGVAKRSGGGMKVHALTANPAVVTCLANDVGYEHIFSEQLAVQAQAGDLLIALSGSGNSPNIVSAIERAGAWACAPMPCSVTAAENARPLPMSPFISRLTTCRSPRICNWSSVTC
jgi:D-sedoheptulose 7-phosphate isomerase